MDHSYIPLSEKEGSPLLEKCSDLSREHGLPSTYVPSRIARQSLFRVLFLHISYAVCYSVLIGIVIARYFNQKENVGPGLIYTPARHVLGYELRNPIPDSHLKLHLDAYFGDPSPELDQNWIDRLRHSSIRLTHEEFEHYNQSGYVPNGGILLGDGSGYLATPTMYHDMHCMEFLHQTIYPEYYWPKDTEEEKEGRNFHARHCLHNIAHSLTCGADMSIRVMQWVPDQILPSPVDTHHECRSWKKIDDWAKERSVDTGAEGMIVHPLLGPVFPGGKFSGKAD